MTPAAAIVEHSFVKFPTVFALLRGRNGTAREYQALVAPTAEYCVIPKVDAYTLGYPEAAGVDDRLPPPNALTFVSFGAYGKGTLFKMAKVEIGEMAFKDVEFLAFDLMQAVGYDVVLGRSLLRHMHVELDFASGRLSMAKVTGAQ